MLDLSVDLYELVLVAEHGDAQLRRRRHVVVEALGHCMPCIDEVLVTTDDVDRELMNVLAVELIRADQREQVGQALFGLCGDVLRPDELAVRSQWNLTGQIKPVADDVR